DLDNALVPHIGQSYPESPFVTTSGKRNIAVQAMTIAVKIIQNLVFDIRIGAFYTVKLDGRNPIVGFTPMVLTVIGCILYTSRSSVPVTLSVFILQFPQVIRHFGCQAGVELNSQALLGSTRFGGNDDGAIFRSGSI